MTLQPRSPSKHNVMLGRKIPHPQSTNFDEKDDDDFALPDAKRPRLDFERQSLKQGNLHESSSPRSNGTNRQRFARQMVEDSEEEDEPPSSAPTDLESALPPVRTDKEAIKEYEISRVAERTEAGDSGDLRSRLDNRKWVRGKSSIYVDAFNLALATVLEEEVHLFDARERAVFNAWETLSYEGQYLYVRLFLRKTAAWHRINRLGYHNDIADLDAAVTELLEQRKLPKDEEADDAFQPDPEEVAQISLGEAFTFADGSAEHITSMNEASSLLQLDELKALAKEARVQGKNKGELLRALRKQSSTQGGLEHRFLKRSDTEDSVKSEMSGVSDDLNAETCRSNRDNHFLAKIFESTGECIRLSAATLKLFERVHLVFYRSTEWTEKSLTTIILARISKRIFPEYIVCRSTNIFPSRQLLVEFEASVRAQFTVDNILEFNGPVTQKGLQRILDIFENVHPRWKVLLVEEQRKEDNDYETGEGAYLHRFSPAWVYTRIMHKAMVPMGRFKQHKNEHNLLSELLGQSLFHPARRGDWYQRKALIEEHYMWALEPSEGRSEEAQKKHWKRIALSTCESGLQDRDCHLKYHYDLQKRIMKLERSLKIPKRQQHDFEHVRFAKMVERDVEGIRVERERSVTPAGRRGSEPGTPAPSRGSRTIWIDEREGGGECSVEEMCLSWYRGQGWKGYHCEGGMVRTLFGFLFYDIMFTFVPNVFQTAYQTCPLDLHSDTFYPSRISLINQRLAEISNGGAKDIFCRVFEQESPKQTCIVGVHWDYEFDDLLEIIDCFKGSALAVVCQVMAQEYATRGGGVPDLFLWHPENREVMFAEVKSENDRLSDTQRLWMHVLTGAGVKVELCHAVAKEVRGI